MTITLLQGDCREVLPTHAPFDLIIIDPPYGDTSLEWDKRVIGWEHIAYQCLKTTGSLWLFGSLRSIMDISPIMRAAGFKYAQDIVWEKHNGSGFHADRFKRVHEHIVQFYREDSPWADVYNDVQTTPDATGRTVRSKKRPPHLTSTDGKARDYASEDGGPRLMRSVIYMPSTHGHAIHPTEKPVGLLEILIRTSCPPNGTVADFFAGSAATALACAHSGRNYVGTEIDPQMAARAQARINGELFANCA